MSPRWRRLFAGLACLAWLSGPRVVAAAEPAPWRIGIVEDPQLMAPTQQVLRELYARAGLRAVQFVPLPLRRAALMLRQGELDADFMRTLAFFDANPSLLRVKVPMRSLIFWAYRQPPCPRALGSEALAATRVAYQTGTVLIEAALPATALVGSATPSDVLERVRNGTAEVGLLAMTPGMVTAVERQHPDLCRVHLPWQTVDLYHALAPHQAHWLPALEASLTGMRRDGTLDRIWAQGEPLLETWHARPARTRH